MVIRALVRLIPFGVAIRWVIIRRRVVVRLGAACAVLLADLSQRDGTAVADQLVATRSMRQVEPFAGLVRFHETTLHCHIQRLDLGLLVGPQDHGGVELHVIAGRAFLVGQQLVADLLLVLFDTIEERIDVKT